MTEQIKDIHRIDNLSIRWSTFEEKILEIVKWEKNYLYGREHEFVGPDSNGIYRTKDRSFATHKSSFTIKEYCYTLASWDTTDEPDLVWCGRRPLDLESKEFNDFIELVRMGYDYLSNLGTEN